MLVVSWLQWHQVSETAKARIIGRKYRDTQVALAVFRYSLSDAESAHFRYILTQTPGDLALYGTLMDQVTHQLAQIRTLTADIPLQQKYLDQIEPLLLAKKQFAQQSIALDKSGNHAGAMQIISSDASRQNMLQIEDAIQNMESVATQLVIQRQFASNHMLKVTAATSAAGLLVNLACIATILLLIRRLQQAQSLVTLEAIKEMINYEDGKLTIEEYLQRRSEALATHGKTQIEAERLLSQIERSKSRSATTRVPTAQTPPV